MKQLSAPDFSEFMREIYGYDPFPWQKMLVDRIAKSLIADPEPAEQLWPRGIDLPTASGKTACIDIAVFSLALSLEPGAHRLAPRRIFFVVDRRIVVDEAHNRALHLADKLKNCIDDGSSPIASEVAQRLRELAGTGAPLLVSKMRGGIVRNDQWTINPAQPAIITSTVDQVGSRLLFRGYGRGERTQSIDAGLAACDSLVLLDEAHCAIPFMQTATAIQRYCGRDWMDEEIGRVALIRPLNFVVLSATLPQDIPESMRFPTTGNERTKALDHPFLQQRIEASKPTGFAIATKARLPAKPTSDDRQRVTEALATKLTESAISLLDGSRKRIAIMVNRVATAQAVFERLQQERTNHDAQPILMTGRMRPIDRDALVDRWSPFLRSSSPATPDSPLVLVTTQCLEVGADFSFDGLVTECASLDSLRQRFGRLNRLGRDEGSQAIVVIRQDQESSSEDDPVYGSALSDSWEWLTNDGKREAIDLGIAALDRELPKNSEERTILLDRLSAPYEDAPVLLPSHVDFFCQTYPHPAPEPEVSLFLHGRQRGAPEARVVFRADLEENGSSGTWIDTIALLPPVSPEALSVPLHHLRRVLATLPGNAEDAGDVEGAREEDSGSQMNETAHRFLLWRGRNDSQVSQNPQDIRPNDTVVLPASKVWTDRLAHYFTRPPESNLLDVTEMAYAYARNRNVLRINGQSLTALFSNSESGAIPSPVDDLIVWSKKDEEERDETELSELLQETADKDLVALPNSLAKWLRPLLADLGKRLQENPGAVKKYRHPAGGLILIGPRIEKEDQEELLLIEQEEEHADENDLRSSSSKEVTLQEHTTHVVEVLSVFLRDASRLFSADQEGLCSALMKAAYWHDLGKGDERFQILLRGRELRLDELSSRKLLAKSDGAPRTRSRANQLRTLAGLPKFFRHEMLSMQLVEKSGMLDDCQTGKRDLVLHLISSHHGYGRPFAPVCPDPEPPPVEVTLDGIDQFQLNGIDITLSHDKRQSTIPPHRLDSGVAERFWSLTRRYGWWGLAWLEAILRLADQYASTQERTNRQRKA